MTPIACRLCPFQSTSTNPTAAIREYHVHACTDALHAMLEAESAVGTLEARVGQLMGERYGRPIRNQELGASGVLLWGVRGPTQ